jgi:uncharacterized protein
MGRITDWLSSLRSKRSADSASELQSKTTLDEGDYKTAYENAMKAYKEDDYKAAYRLFKPLADQELSPEFGLLFGFLSSLRQDVLSDPIEMGKLYTGKLYRKEAMEWYRKKADQGGANVKYSLGYMFENGKGVPQDYAEARMWYRKAADQGHADAQHNLGSMYENRKGVPQDFTEAVKWYRKAADQGYADAQYSLGVMYEKGQGVPQDNTEAMKWYRKAADQGYADAPYNIAGKYESGKGVPQDHAEAQRLAREWKLKKK